MYIMCVILCLFSALSRRVGALHISIMIIIIICVFGSQFAPFNCYSSSKKGLTPKIQILCFVIINSVLCNLSCLSLLSDCSLKKGEGWGALGRGGGGPYVSSPKVLGVFIFSEAHSTDP